MAEVLKDKLIKTAEELGWQVELYWDEKNKNIVGIGYGKKDEKAEGVFERKFEAIEEVNIAILSYPDECKLNPDKWERI